MNESSHTAQAELEQARRELRSLAARLNGILDAAVDGLIVIDERAIVESLNPAAEKIFGYRSEEVLGRNVSMLMPQPYRREHDGYMDNFLRTGQAKIIGIGREVTGLRRDGSVFPMYLAVGELVTEEEGRHFVGIIRDITRLKEAEASLREREAQLRLLFDHTPVGILMCDARGRIKAVNSAFCTLLGRDEYGLMSTDFAALLNSEDREQCDQEIKRLLGGNAELLVHEVRFSRADGAVVHATLHCAVVNNPGNEAMVVVQAVDRTDQVKAEADAREHRDRLAHVGRLSTMGEMASGIAHELNQPLTAIATYAQATRRLLDSGEGRKTELNDALEQIGRQAERSGEIIRRFRGFVRKHETGSERVDVNEQLRLVVRLADVDARAHQMRVEMKLGEGLPTVMADAIQIQQVILNLIRNAIDAMDDMPDGQRTVMIASLLPSRDCIEVQVIDRGSGIPESLAERLFTPFLTTKKEGTGLGLTISSSIIDAHGGKLWFTPNPAGGACFHFTLPVALGEGND